MSNKFFAAKCPSCGNPVVRKQHQKPPYCVDCKIKKGLPI